MTQTQLQPWQYWSAIIFSGLTTVGGAALIIFGINFLREGWASRNWPIAEGEVQAVKVLRDISGSGSTKTVRHYIAITYDYEVKGISYSGDRYSLGDGSSASKKFKERREVIAEKNKYPLGSAIDVYYRPTNPDSAILKPGINTANCITKRDNNSSE